MYKYLIGTSDPKGTKRKQTPEERAVKLKEYDST